MTDVSAASQQLFDLWKKQLDEGAQSWARALGQNPTPTPDPLSMWIAPYWTINKTSSSQSVLGSDAPSPSVLK